MYWISGVCFVAQNWWIGSDIDVVNGNGWRKFIIDGAVSCIYLEVE